MTDIELVPLAASDRNQFILDNQEAFNYGALVEFGLRDDHFEEPDEIISRGTIEKSIDDGEAYQANCLSNADFLLSGSVVIRKYPDKIVFSNPGTIRLGKKQMLRGGESQPRNKLILNMLNYIGIGERAGSGVPNIYKIWKEENFEEPKVEETSGRDGIIRTIVTLPLVLKGSTLAISEKQPEKSPEKPLKHSEIMEKRIGAVLEMIKADPSVSRAEISARMQISDSQARTAIEKLKERGIIRREGSDTNGKWVISL